jgi:hypothetical protein
MFAIACGSCNSSRRDKPLWVFIAKRGIADTIAPVIKAFLGRAKATEVLVQQEFVNLLTSRPQVNGTNPWRSLKSMLGVLVLFQPFQPAWLYPPSMINHFLKNEEPILEFDVVAQYQMLRLSRTSSLTTS